MPHIKRVRIVILSGLAIGLIAAWPTAAEAQRRAAAVRRPAARPVVVVRTVAYPRFRSFGYFGPWFRYGYHWAPYPPYGYGYGYGYPYGYGYGYGFRDQLISSLRLDVTPRDAIVYVDGYAAGEVDDFDGIFQRLRLRPGGHDIVVYLDGHRTFRQQLYLNPGSTQTIRHTMERLAPGEPMEPPPTPQAAPDAASDPAMPRFPFEPRTGGASSRESSASFGTLSVRVQPRDAEILVDGEPWSAPLDRDRLTLELAEGRHTIEVRKPGFADYREEVLIRRNATLSLNVSLLGGGTDAP